MEAAVHPGVRYRQLDRQWYEYRRLRELATGTDEYGVYAALMDEVRFEMEALVASPEWSFSGRPAQIIGAR